MEAADSGKIFGVDSYSHDLSDQSFEIQKIGHVKRGVPKGYIW